MCHVCNTVLIVEPLERRLPFLQRHEEKWRKPMPMFERFKWILLDPSKAIWDVVHKPTGDGGIFTFFMNVLLFGLVGVVLFNKLDMSQVLVGFGGTPPVPLHYTDLPLTMALHGLGMYVMFVVIGMLYFGILWGFLSIAHGISSKYTLNIVPKWREQSAVMAWPFFPSLFATGLYVAVLAIGLPTRSLGAIDMTGTNALPPEAIAAIGELFFSARSLSAWIVADVVQIAFYFGYLSILIAIAYRELYDKSTTKALISAIIVGIIGAFVYVLTRSSFFG